MNARIEFEEHVKGCPVKCATISKATSFSTYEEIAKLRDGHTPEEYEVFLNNLDFEYDSGFGEQELEGAIWYKGGTWSDREEYDGSEWWVYRKAPDIPKSLTKAG